MSDRDSEEPDVNADLVPDVRDGADPNVVDFGLIIPELHGQPDAKLDFASLSPAERAEARTELLKLLPHLQRLAAEEQGVPDPPCSGVVNVVNKGKPLVSSQDFHKFMRLLDTLKLSYSGRIEENLKFFLEELKFHASGFKLSDMEMLRSLSYCLKGKANEWYKGRANVFNSFQDFEQALITRFFPKHTQTDLKRALQSTTMSENQLLGDYITQMLAQNQALIKPMKDNKLLDIILQRMSPIYKSRLATSVTAFKSVAALEICAAKADRDVQAEKVLQGKTQHRLAAVTPVASTSSSPQVSSRETARARHCYYCLETSHLANVCPKRQADKAVGVVNWATKRQAGGSSSAPSYGAKPGTSASQSTRMSEEEIAEIVKAVTASMNQKLKGNRNPSPQ